MSTAAVVAAMIAAGAAFHLLRPPYAYVRGREPDPGLWRDRYPPEEYATARLVLDAIVNAFLLRRSDVDRLRPDDRLSAIYTASYPRGGADAFEYENLQITLREMFQVPEEDLTTFFDATIEDVIRMCLATGSRRA